jgi:hypothetical protein
MRRIIYRSLAAPGIDKVETFRLVYQARAANEARGLGGFLVHIDDRFFQVLEGHTWKLVAAFETIRRDGRHAEVEVIDERTIPEASFGSWRMRYFDGRDIPRMLAQISEVAGGRVPRIVLDSLIDFLGPELLRPVTSALRPVSLPTPPVLLEAALPSSPRLC